jgi:tRNA pseudouridine32 synthase/23S rRNA pseudouridine746 synthase
MSTDPVAHQAAVYDPPPDAGLQALYMDEHLLVVDKPSGLLTVPGRGDHLQDCLIHRVQRDVPEAMIVHRLDMATSGLVVLAREVDKRYEAMLHGLLAQDAGEIDLPLITDWPRRPRQMVDHAHGKPSQTRYQVTDRDEVRHRTRVDLEPLTGRSHQLRVHCLAIGHAILGDPLYGPDESRQASDRLMLHATSLVMPHPVSGVRLQWVAPCPF